MPPRLPPSSRRPRPRRCRRPVPRPPRRPAGLRPSSAAPAPSPSAKLRGGFGAPRATPSLEPPPRSLAEAARRPKEKARLTITGLPAATPAAAAAATGGDSGGGAAGNESAGPSTGGDARAAQARMDRAVERGLRYPNNVRTSGSARDAARREWDAAADECRRTPGCAPVYRDGPGFAEKPLKTDDELIEDKKRQLGLSGEAPPHPRR